MFGFLVLDIVGFYVKDLLVWIYSINVDDDSKRDFLVIVVNNLLVIIDVMVEF